MLLLQLLELPDLNENKKHPIRCDLHLNECMFIFLCVCMFQVSHGIYLTETFLSSGNFLSTVTAMEGQVWVTALNTVVGEQVSDLLRPVELFTFSWPVAIHG